MAEKKTKKDSAEKQPKGAEKKAKSAPEKEIKINDRLADIYKKEVVPGNYHYIIVFVNFHLSSKAL